MSDIAFVLGNGESRKGIQIEDLKNTVQYLLVMVFIEPMFQIF